MAKLKAMPTALLKAATLEQRIQDACKSRKQMQTEEHELLFQSVMHAQQHGDTTFISQIINGMPNGSRVTAMVQWLKAHFPVEGRVEKNDKGVKLVNIYGREKVIFKLKKDRKPTDWQLEKAWAVPFYDFTKETPASVFNTAGLVVVLNGYIKRGEEAMATGKFKGTKEEYLANKAAVQAIVRQLTEAKGAEVQAKVVRLKEVQAA